MAWDHVLKQEFIPWSCDWKLTFPGHMTPNSKLSSPGATCKNSQLKVRWYRLWIWVMWLRHTTRKLWSGAQGQRSCDSNSNSSHVTRRLQHEVGVSKSSLTDVNTTTSWLLEASSALYIRVNCCAGEAHVFSDWRLLVASAVFTSYTLLKPKRHSLRCPGFMVHA